MLKGSIKSVISCIVIFILFTKVGFSQDPHFTQFYANPLYLNPAFAGSKICPRISLNYRNQWPSIQGQFITYSASYDQQMDALNGGVGALVYQDQAGNGTIKTFNFSGMYAYTLPVTRTFSIRAGFQATFHQRTIEWDKLTFGDMIDPRYGFVKQTQEKPGDNTAKVPDFSIGFLGYTENFFAGLAIHHLTEPDESFFGGASPLYRRLTFHAGTNIYFNKRKPELGSISPNVMFRYQGPHSEQNLGLYGRKGPFVAGLWYRINSDFIVLVGLQTDQFKFGYSYDLTTSKLTNKVGGSHEISLGFQLPCKPKRQRRRRLQCPEF